MSAEWILCSPNGIILLAFPTSVGISKLITLLVCCCLSPAKCSVPMGCPAPTAVCAWLGRLSSAQLHCCLGCISCSTPAMLSSCSLCASHSRSLSVLFSVLFAPCCAICLLPFKSFGAGMCTAISSCSTCSWCYRHTEKGFVKQCGCGFCCAQWYSGSEGLVFVLCVGLKAPLGCWVGMHSQQHLWAQQQGCTDTLMAEVHVPVSDLNTACGAKQYPILIHGQLEIFLLQYRKCFPRSSALISRCNSSTFGSWNKMRFGHNFSPGFLCSRLICCIDEDLIWIVKLGRGEELLQCWSSLSQGRSNGRSIAIMYMMPWCW